MFHRTPWFEATTPCKAEDETFAWEDNRFRPSSAKVPRQLKIQKPCLHNTAAERKVRTLQRIVEDIQDNSNQKLLAVKQRIEKLHKAPDRKLDLQREVDTLTKQVADIRRNCREREVHLASEIANIDAQIRASSDNIERLQAKVDAITDQAKPASSFTSAVEWAVNFGDCPGKYILSADLPVSAEEEPPDMTPYIQFLPMGTSVDVAEVVFSLSLGHVRARLVAPLDGWISTYDSVNDVRWAYVKADFLEASSCSDTKVLIQEIFASKQLDLRKLSAKAAESVSMCQTKLFWALSRNVDDACMTWPGSHNSPLCLAKDLAFRAYTRCFDIMAAEAKTLLLRAELERSQMELADEESASAALYHKVLIRAAKNHQLTVANDVITKELDKQMAGPKQASRRPSKVSSGNHLETQYSDLFSIMRALSTPIGLETWSEYGAEAIESGDTPRERQDSPTSNVTVRSSTSFRRATDLEVAEVPTVPERLPDITPSFATATSDLEGVLDTIEVVEPSQAPRTLSLPLRRRTSDSLVAADPGEIQSLQACVSKAARFPIRMPTSDLPPRSSLSFVSEAGEAAPSASLFPSGVDSSGVKKSWSLRPNVVQTLVKGDKSVKEAQDKSWERVEGKLRKVIDYQRQIIDRFYDNESLRAKLIAARIAASSTATAKSTIAARHKLSRIQTIVKRLTADLGHELSAVQDWSTKLEAGIENVMKANGTPQLNGDVTQVFGMLTPHVERQGQGGPESLWALSAVWQSVETFAQAELASMGPPTSIPKLVILDNRFEEECTSRSSQRQQVKTAPPFALHS